MTEDEARAIVYAIGTAMFNDDKELREFAYEGLNEEELKKVLRWAMRQNLYNFSQIALMNGVEPLEAWKMASLDRAVREVFAQEED